MYKTIKIKTEALQSEVLVDDSIKQWHQ